MISFTKAEFCIANIHIMATQIMKKLVLRFFIGFERRGGGEGGG